MENYTIQQGETIRLKVTVQESGADTAELYASDGTNTIENTVSFSGNEADLTTNTSPTQVPGTYPYYVRITWLDGSVDILTLNESCEDDEDCGLPAITVCEIKQGA